MITRIVRPLQNETNYTGLQTIGNAYSARWPESEGMGPTGVGILLMLSVII